MKSVKFLEDLSELTGMNDSQMAKKLNVTRSAVCQYKSGKRIMENETCVAVALELGIDPLKIIIAADMDRAEKTGQHSLWEVFMQRAAATASTALILAVVAGLTSPEAANARESGSNPTLSANYSCLFANVPCARHFPQTGSQARSKDRRMSHLRSFCFWAHPTVKLNVGSEAHACRG